MRDAAARARASLAAALTLLGAACSVADVAPRADGVWLRAPAVEFATLRGRPGDDDGRRLFWIDVDVRNPNRFTLALRGIDVELVVDGVRLVRGLDNRPLAVAPLGVARLSVAAVMSERDQARLVDALRRPARAPAVGSGDDSAYVLSGQVYLGHNGAISSVPFRGRGRLRLD